MRIADRRRDKEPVAHQEVWQIPAQFEEIRAIVLEDSLYCCMDYGLTGIPAHWIEQQGPRSHSRCALQQPWKSRAFAVAGGGWGLRAAKGVTCAARSRTA